MLRLDRPEVAHACPEDNALLSIAKGSSLSMLTEYLTAALESAHFEIIEDSEPLYGQIPALKGAWATGPTLEECRRNLASALEDWVLFSIARGLELPVVGSVCLVLPQRIPA